jgi:hypothetical protein
MGRAGCGLPRNTMSLKVRDMVALTEVAIKICGEEFGDGYLFYPFHYPPDEAEVFLYCPVTPDGWWRAEVPLPSGQVGCWVPPEVAKMAMAFPEFLGNIKQPLTIRTKTGIIMATKWKRSGDWLKIIETTDVPTKTKVRLIRLNRGQVNA